MASELVCPACGAQTAHAGVIDLVVTPSTAPSPARRSIADRAMASRAMAAVYEALWRPVTFALSTAFRAPSFDDEASRVIARIGDAPGPWLDLSCGPGTMTRRLCADAAGRTVVAVDLSAAMLERARRAAPDATFVRADAQSLPFAGGAFGAVVNLAALDLYPDAARAIAESARVLRPGGTWIASTFTPRHLRADRVTDLARDAGFADIQSRAHGPYLVAWATKR